MARTKQTACRGKGGKGLGISVVYQTYERRKQAEAKQQD
jgi:hypothetical protein